MSETDAPTFHNFKQYLKWLQLHEDAILLRRAYIDIAGDLAAGVMLSQLVFWHLPNPATGKTKLRVDKQGHRWVAKSDKEWWDECRLTVDQARRARSLLVKTGVVESRTFKFNGTPTTHLRIVEEEFLIRLQGQVDSGHSPSPTGLQPESLTEITTEITTEIPPTPKGDGGVKEKESLKKEAVLVPFLGAWNELKRPEWVHHQVLDKRAQGQIRELAKWSSSGDLYDSALTAFRAAVKWAATRESWCSDRKGTTLVEVGANSKFIQYAEKAAHEASSPVKSSVSKAVHPDTILRQKWLYEGARAFTEDGDVVTIVEQMGEYRRVRHEDGREDWFMRDQLRSVEESE